MSYYSFMRDMNINDSHVCPLIIPWDFHHHHKISPLLFSHTNPSQVARWGFWSAINKCLAKLSSYSQSYPCLISNWPWNGISMQCKLSLHLINWKLHQVMSKTWWLMSKKFKLSNKGFNKLLSLKKVGWVWFNFTWGEINSMCRESSSLYWENKFQVYKK